MKKKLKFYRISKTVHEALLGLYAYLNLFRRQKRSNFKYFTHKKFLTHDTSFPIYVYFNKWHTRLKRGKSLQFPIEKLSLSQLHQNVCLCRLSLAYNVLVSEVWWVLKWKRRKIVWNFIHLTLLGWCCVHFCVNNKFTKAYTKLLFDE